jgi:hypothetical protein
MGKEISFPILTCTFSHTHNAHNKLVLASENLVLKIFTKYLAGINKSCKLPWSFKIISIYDENYPK